MFINLKAVMDRGLDFSVVNDTLGFSLKAYLCKIFIEKCRTPVFYTKLREFLEKLNSLENDQTKLAFLFSFPDVLYQARDEYTKIAKSYDYTIRNVCISGIPHSLVERYKEWNEGHLDIAIQKMKQAIYSSFYKTWQMKIIMCFEILDTVFLFLSSELENTINSLDGEIDEEIEKKIKQSGGLSNDRC
jgi:hypothetical protein